ncbi:MAG: hypothetical protein FJ288_08280 [Planctomycetes bacterium]|nr:hypothetical protein [Planctomycetota bacterium]
MSTYVRWAVGMAMVCALVSGARGQSFSLDDNAMAPISTPPPGSVAPFGVGAEGEWVVGAGLAPSPSLPPPFSVPVVPAWDGTIFSPFLPHGFPPPAFTPNGNWIDAFSTNKEPS